MQCMQQVETGMFGLEVPAPGGSVVAKGGRNMQAGERETRVRALRRERERMQKVWL